MMGVKLRVFTPLADVSLEQLVPRDHFYRRLEHALDLSFVRALVADSYATGGRPSIDPVVFFKLQLVMFFERIHSERQLMTVVADRLSVRWYLGYDLHESLPDHSSLTRIRDRYGLDRFRRFFDAIVERCDQAGLVWGRELFFDATKVEANASLESVAPRFAIEAHLASLFADTPDAPSDDATIALAPEPPPLRAALPGGVTDTLTEMNSRRHDWWAEVGRQQRDVVNRTYQRIADFRSSATDPDASLMRARNGGVRLGYHTHYVVDGGKARVILAALVPPSEVMENQPMLDLLWHTRFRWRAWPHHVTADTTYGTLANIVAIEDAHIRAYLPVRDANKREPLFGQRAFSYDADRDVYRCPQGETLRVTGHSYTERTIRYQAPAAACDACPVKARCTTGAHGRQVYRNFDEAYLDRVRAYHETEPYKRAMRKRKVWIEPGALWAASAKRRIGTGCDDSDCGGYAR
jgi:transposase